jgi:hypothetical protein
MVERARHLRESMLSQLNTHVDDVTALTGTCQLFDGNHLMEIDPSNVMTH